MAIGVKISTILEGDVHIVSLEGRVDASSTPLVEKKLEGLISSSKKILIDCTNIHYLSSAGMRLFLSMTKKMHAQQGSIGFFGMSDDVLEIIKMAGFERILKIFNTKNEALKSLE